MNNEIKLEVAEKYVAKRLDTFISNSLKDISRTRIQRLVKDNLILVNKKSAKSGYKLKADDEILISLPDLEEAKAEPENIKLEVIHEDKDLIVINKPQGMVTHPASGVYKGTLVNALLYHCRDSLSGINGVLRPGIVHRLDKETSGLIIACKNDKSHIEIAEQIKNKKLKRQYLAVVHGEVKYSQGVINKPIGRDKKQRHKMAVVQGGRIAITHWKVVKTLHVTSLQKKYTLLECTLETGRTHQIRVHMASIGYSIAGDKTYGKKNDPIDTMMLHAYKLTFIHPRTKKEIRLETKVPKRFSIFLESNNCK